MDKNKLKEFFEKNIWIPAVGLSCSSVSLIVSAVLVIGQGSKYNWTLYPSLGAFICSIMWFVINDHLNPVILEEKDPSQ